jgi:hypothetical protein
MFFVMVEPTQVNLLMGATLIDSYIVLVRVKVTDEEKQCSLLQYGINYSCKMFFLGQAHCFVSLCLFCFFLIFLF